MCKTYRKSIERAGVLKTEVLLALFILVAAMNVASPLIHRINRVWIESQKHQFAINELANQLDALSQLSPTEVPAALESLEVSTAGKEALGDPKLSGNTKTDELGTRLTLELMWNERNGGAPIQLSTWINNPDPEKGELP